MEHRFFGQSQPFNLTDSYTPTADRLGLLSVEQGMADYAALISSILNTHKAWQSPVITFGGSLAGTLAAFMRMKYPGIVDMAWASSTPMQGYAGLATSQYVWREQVTANWAAIGGTDCPPLARRAFAALANQPAAVVKKLFAVCEPEYPLMWNDVCVPPPPSPCNGHRHSRLQEEPRTELFDKNQA
jgi:lysosomal Pro-X carboxypeptidase